MNGNENNEMPQESLAQAPLQAEVQRPGLLQVIWGRKWAAIATVALCLAGGFAYLVKATPIFTSTSRLYVEQSGPKIISEAEGVMTQSKNYLYTQCELLTSTPILASALEKPGIRRMKTFGEVDNPLAYLKKLLEVEVGKKDDIISASLDSPYPKEAANIVNAVVESYVTYHSTRKRSTAAEVLRILQKEKSKRDVELASKLKEMLEFKKASGALSFENDQGNIVIQRLAKLSDALTTAQLETISAKVDDEAAKAMVDDPAKIRQLVEARHAGGVYISAGSRDDAELRQELRLTRQRVSELARDYSEQHPGLQAAKARVSQLEEDLAEAEKQFAEAYAAAAGQRYIMTQKREQQLQKSYDDQQELAQEANVKGAEFAMLQSALERTEKLCDILDSRIKEINVTEDTGALNISILEVAKAADDPSKPRKARTMAIALVLGLMLGVGLSLVMDWMDQRLRSVQEVAAALGTPILGVVPHMNGKQATVRDRGMRVQADPKSNAAEAYRTIRTAVYFGVPDGQAKTLLITSPTPGDGKTTLVSNLAIAMAQAGQRTLVLDADFRKPMQHKIFESKDDEGLSNVLAGRGNLNELIQRTEVDGLDILPCGPIPPNPSEMLNSRPFAEALKELAKRYDRVLIDSPPVMPVADARILGAISDVTLMVLRAEKSTRKAAEQAREGLLSVGAHILGAVINDAPRRRGRYGYYGYYSGYGHYGYGYGRKSREGEGQGETREARSAAAESRE